MHTIPIKIHDLFKYRTFEQRYPDAAPIKKEIFEDPNFRRLIYTPTPEGNSLWEVIYITSEGDEVCITEKQLVQFMLRKKSNEFDKALLCLTSWEDFFIEKVCDNTESKMDYTEMVNRFIPQDKHTSVFDECEDDFYKNLAESCHGWKIDSNDFENSSIKDAICKIETKHALDGGHMEYDAATAWFDPNTEVMASYVIGDFCEALSRACKLLHPGSDAGISELKDESLSPLAQTREYKRAIAEGLIKFGSVFGLV